MSEYKKIFTDTFHQNLWDAESRSGEGSTVEAARHLIRELPLLFKRLGITSLLDIPCGDFMWMNTVDLSGVHYTGADLVEEMIARNNQQFAGPARDFVTLDLTRDKLPETDAVLCRDCFIHLTLPQIFQSLNNIARTRARYLLTTHFPWRGFSSNDPINEVFLGGRRINLEIAPFEFPPPVASIAEGVTLFEIAMDKCLAVWPTADVRQALIKTGNADF